MKSRLNESGISLVEVIASIVILSVILISIFTMLTQSGRTTKNNEDIVEATYLAQTEMEKLYDKSQTTLFADYENAIDLELDYDIISPETEYEKDITTPNRNFYIQVIISKTDPILLTTHIIINVYDEKSSPLKTPKAQMQNTLEWRRP